MLKCKDFVPADKTGFFAINRQYETVDELLLRVNAWLRSANVKPVTVETVITRAVAHGGLSATLPQTVRVWFEE